MKKTFFLRGKFVPKFLYSNADKVDNLMADIEDQLQVHQEISDAISQSFGVQYDEDELDAELAALEEESLNESLGAVHVPQAKVCHFPLLSHSPHPPPPKQKSDFFFSGGKTSEKCGRGGGGRVTQVRNVTGSLKRYFLGEKIFIYVIICILQNINMN